MEEKPKGYAGDYGEKPFWDKVRNHARQAGSGLIEMALQLYYAARDEKTPAWARATIYGALGYFIAPVDAVPDIIPGMGFVDDLGVLTAAVAAVAMAINEEHRSRARGFMAKVFGDGDSVR